LESNIDQQILILYAMKFKCTKLIAS
jgi:hypothetical protein